MFTEGGNGLRDGGKITVKTVEEQKYVNMLLDVLRGVNEQWKHSLMMTIVSSHRYCSEKRALDPSCVKRKTLRERVDEYDSDAINTLEYGFYYVSGVLATAQRISQADSNGETEQVPEDFYWIVGEARERLDKIMGLLGFLIEKE